MYFTLSYYDCQVSFKDMVTSLCQVAAALSLNLRPSGIIFTMDFQLVTSYTPQGDQPRAIDELMNGLAAGRRPKCCRAPQGLDSQNLSVNCGFE
jgi:hypothetical protein